MAEVTVVQMKETVRRVVDGRLKTFAKGQVYTLPLSLANEFVDSGKAEPLDGGAKAAPGPNENKAAAPPKNKTKR